MENTTRTAGLLAPVLSLLAAPLCAQVTLNTDDYAFSGSQSNKNLVRDSAGKLYCLSVSQNAVGDRPLLLLASSDGGDTWQADPIVLNTATTGLNAPNPTTTCALAIDDQDRLHTLWGNYHYPSHYQQWYRQYDPATGVASTTVNVSAQTGASVSSRTAAMDLVVDQQNTVWLAAHGVGSWVEELVRSNAPYASSLTFSSVGSVSPSASAQTTRVCVDMAGRIHCSYYRNISPGVYEHRFYDPLANSWSLETIIGDTTGVNDFNGSLAADALGNVHALVLKNSHSGSSLWETIYRRWDTTNGWSSEVLLFGANQAQHSGIANDRIITLACNETSGKVTAIYRDLSAGGLLRTSTKELADASFSAGADLTAPSINPHAYYTPLVRGSLYPASNRTSSNVHVTWQHRPMNGTPPYSLMFDSVFGSVGNNFCPAAPNSVGTGASIFAEGSNSLAANDLVLHVSGIPNQPGLFIYGATQMLTPFGNGFLCVATPRNYLYPPTFATQNEAMRAVDYTSLPVGGQITTGTTWNFQHWSRDPAAGGMAFNTSDGLTVSFAP